MPKFDEVRRAVCPAGVWLCSAEEQRLEVSWVRVVRARVPALEGLGAGDLAIVPDGVLDALVAAGVEPTGLVEDLSHAGVPGLVLVGEGAPNGHGATLVAAACAGRVPLLRVSGVDGAQLERSIVGFLVNRRAEIDRQAARVETQVERLALLGRDLEALASAVGGFVGRAVAIEDERGTPVVVSAPAGVADSASAASRYLVQPRAVALRVALPGGGAVALLGTLPPTELDRTVAERVAPLLALQIDREAEVRRAREAGRAERLPPSGPPWVVIVARQVVTGEPASLDERAAVRERLARLGPAGRLLLRGDVRSQEYRLVAALEPADPLGLGIASRAAATVGREVAISRPFGTSDGRSAAEAEARAALEAAESLPAMQPRPASAAPRVARADRLAAYRLLGDMHNLPAGRRLSEDLLAPLLAGRASQRSRRLETLAAILELGSAAEAAAALGVHRNTLLYRMRGIERLTGWQLDDPELRLALILALRFVRTSQ